LIDPSRAFASPGRSGCATPRRVRSGLWRQTAKARELWTLSKVDFARTAQDMGALGIRVEQVSAFPAELAQALAAERPVVIDVETDIDALAPTAVV
jgi:thiamine pyrophosphate-dependent acetolactate synthase large subunit-like protein